MFSGDGVKQQQTESAIRNSAKVIGEPAGILRILSAMVYDGLLIIGCLIALGFVAFTLNSAQPIREGWKLSVLRLAICLLWGGFYAYFCSRQGQTLGMRAWKLVLSDGQGHVPIFRRVLWRWLIGVTILMLPFSIFWHLGLVRLENPILLYSVLLMPIGLAYLSRYFLPQKRSLIDILSRTQILRVQQNPYPKIKRSKKDVS